MQGGTDITASFLAACTLIPHGATIKASNLHMLDAMNALTIGDPRMDTGVRRARQSKREEPEIGEREACAIVDRLVQNEVRFLYPMGCESAYERLPIRQMAFHAGWPMIPTTFTSRHLLNPSLLQPSSTTIQRALASYLEAYKRSLALVWQELSKGAVFEGEDWMGDLGGLWGDGEEWEEEGEVALEIGECCAGLLVEDDRKTRIRFSRFKRTLKGGCRSLSTEKRHLKTQFVKIWYSRRHRHCSGLLWQYILPAEWSQRERMS